MAGFYTSNINIITVNQLCPNSAVGLIFFKFLARCINEDTNFPSISFWCSSWRFMGIVKINSYRVEMNCLRWCKFFHHTRETRARRVVKRRPFFKGSYNTYTTNRSRSFSRHTFAKEEEAPSFALFWLSRRCFSTCTTCWQIVLKWR